MKKILTLFLLCLNTIVYGQYSGLTVIPNDRSVICSFENIDDNNFGFYVGAYYKVGQTSSPYIYRTPYMYFNRIGINYGFLKCGLVVGAGVKTDLTLGPDPVFYPDVMVKLQPIKLLTRKKDIWDVSVTVGVSDVAYIGFGISIPYRYGTYYR